MPRQFDVYCRPNGILVVILQHDHLDGLRTRVVVPLLPASTGPRPVKRLNPEVIIEGRSYHLGMEFPAAATEAELGTFVTSIAYLHDDITRAVDLLFTGV